MAALLRIIEKIISRLPYKVFFTVGAGIGLLAYHLDNQHRFTAISNISRALEVSPDRARAIARKAFINSGINIIEFFNANTFTRPPWVGITGIENIDWDKGNIFVLGHFGNWELLGRIGAQYSLQLVAVGRGIKSKGLDKYIQERRTFSGLELVNKKGSFKHLLRGLKQGKSAAILIDQYAGRRGVFVDFLGIPTSTTASPVLLALRTGCPIVPVFIIRERAGYRIFIESPVTVVKTGNINRDIQTGTQLMVRPLERYVKRYPDQWWWVHRRWR